MNRVIDELMVRWAEELHGPDSHVLAATGGSTLARLIASKGVLISRTSGTGDMGSVSADIELIVNKHLPEPLRRLAMVHYTDHDRPDSMKRQLLGIGRSQYYRRLSLLHAAVTELLVQRRKAA